MRKSSLTIIILIAAMTAVWAQEPVLSNRIKKYFELHDVVDKMDNTNIDGSKIIINLVETNF